MSCIPIDFLTHTPKIRRAQEIPLTIGTALSAIVLLGGVIGTLALAGVPLAGLNALAAGMPGGVITTLIVGGIAFGGFVTLSVAFMDKVRNRQLSQAEINASDIPQWYRENEIGAKLEEGECWRLPLELGQGFVCHGDKLYVFRKAADCSEMEDEFRRLGWNDGEDRFLRESTGCRIPVSYVTKLGLKLPEALKGDLYSTCEWQHNDETFYGIMRREGLDVFTTAAARDALKAERFNKDELPPYLPPGHYWQITKGAYLFNNVGEIRYKNCTPASWVNAEEVIKDPTRWPDGFEDKLRDEFDLTIDFTSIQDGEYRIEQPRVWREHPLYAVVGKDAHGHATVRFTRSAEAAAALLPRPE